MLDATVEISVADLAAPIRNALVGGPFGSDLGTADYVQSGVPVIRGQNLSSGKYVAGEFVFVSDEKAEKLKANLARPGDLVFTQRGNAVLHGGQVAIVPDQPFDRYVVSQSQMKLTPDRTKVDARYLYFVFTSADFKHYLQSNAVVTGVPHINLRLLRDYSLSLPPLAEQEAIAAVLGALDDKTELNQPDRGSYFLALNPPASRVASTGFAVLSPTTAPWSYIHAALTQSAVSDHLGQMADGGAYPAVRPEIIGAMKVAQPSERAILDAFHRICAPLFEQAEANRNQSRTLAALRDTLLPKLLSGELSVALGSSPEFPVSSNGRTVKA